MTLSEIIELHINGIGNGYEIDDVLSNKLFPQSIVEDIVAIGINYRTLEYPVGLSNPDAYEDLRSIANFYDNKEI